MEKLIIKNDEVGHQKLKEILTSYQGLERKLFASLPKAIETIILLLEQDSIELFEEEYVKNFEETYDKEIQEIYTTLMNQARWKDGETKPKEIRINALNILRHLGTPTYDQFIYYHSKDIAMHCGNLTPHDFLHVLNNNPKLKELIIFAKPTASKDNIQKYYRFIFSEKVKEVAQRYQEDVMIEMHNIMSKSENILIKRR